MNIFGIPVADEDLQKLCDRMKSLGTFDATEITNAAIELGYPAMAVPPGKMGKETIAYRIVDRLLQRERKAGRIALKTGRRWEWVG